MPLSFKGGSGVWFAVAAGLAILAFLFGLLGWTVEWLWMGELGYRQVFWRIRLTQAGLFFAVFLPALFYFWANAVIMIRITTLAEAAMPVGPWARAKRRDPAPGWAIRAALVLLPMLVALLLATSFASTWDDFIRFSFAKSFGRVEPILGRDAGFYVFILPFLDDIQDKLVVIATLGVGLHLLAYHQIGLLRNWKAADEDLRRRVLWALSANAAFSFYPGDGVITSTASTCCSSPAVPCLVRGIRTSMW